MHLGGSIFPDANWCKVCWNVGIFGSGKLFGKHGISWHTVLVARKMFFYHNLNFGVYWPVLQPRPVVKGLLADLLESYDFPRDKLLS